MNKHFFSLGLIALMMTGCTYFNRIYVEQDIVKHTKRVTYEMNWSRNEPHEPYYTQKLTFLKETDENNKVKYTLYDVIILPVESFDLEEEMYVLADNEVMPLPVSRQSKFNTRNVNEKKDEVMQTDSTKVTVVTGYNIIERKTTQMIHQLDEDMISKIAGAQKVALRYYVGHAAINTEIKGSRLHKVKKWIAK